MYNNKSKCSLLMNKIIKSEICIPNQLIKQFIIDFKINVMLF